MLNLLWRALFIPFRWIDARFSGCQFDICIWSRATVIYPLWIPFDLSIVMFDRKIGIQSLTVHTHTHSCVWTGEMRNDCPISLMHILGFVFHWWNITRHHRTNDIIFCCVSMACCWVRVVPNQQEFNLIQSVFAENNNKSLDACIFWNINAQCYCVSQTQNTQNKL